MAGTTATPKIEDFPEFEFEYCHECGGDLEDHILCEGPFGLPFAMCKFAPIVKDVGFRHGQVIRL